MKSKFNRLLGAGLSVSLLLTAVPWMGKQIQVQGEELVEVSEEEMNALTTDTSFTRGSVHDPSVVADGNGTYYVFGSHMGVAKTTDLMNWTGVTTENETSSLFGVEDENKNITTVSYNQAFRDSAYEGTVTTVINGVETELDFGSFDASAWNTALDNFTVAGNMWAPDVVYNQTTQKWSMYLSLNGSKWNSTIILLTADAIEGPYVYQGPVVFSGFSTDTEALSFEYTDLELVYGELDALPVQYDKADDGTWGEYWPHAIDPAVFYDEEGNLILSYGSWSGGIYELQLDETTGLRDYTVSYPSDFDGNSKTINSDAYFGTKIAGGYYVSGEGSYVQKIGDYYYLYLSYGFYSPEGGYNMRIFRSDNPAGPFLDSQGNDARYTSFSLNYDADWGSVENTQGSRLMTNYKWDTMNVAEVSQGHNSAITDSNGRSFLVYHTKYNDGTAAHELRVHELFQSENGWLLASPYEYTATNASIDYGANVATADVIGDYQIIVNSYEVGYDASAENHIAVVKPQNITLNEDKTITGEYTGNWEIKDGTPYCTLNINGSTYSGVFVKQSIDSVGITTMCFTIIDETTGITLWGSKTLSQKEALALNVKNNTVNLPEITYANVTLPTDGLNNTTITWSSNKEDILTSEGVYNAPQKDTDVTMTMTMINDGYRYSKDYVITAKAAQTQNTFLLASYFKDTPKDLTQYKDGSLVFDNPFYQNTSSGLDVSQGVTFTFDADATGTVNVLATLFSMQGNGRFYFTPGSYLGYNATGGWYDANLANYSLVNDYIGDFAHVTIQLTPTGFSLSMNDTVVYTESTLAAGTIAGTLTDYTNVLNWITDSAQTITFGAGSWWNDVANCTISNFNCYVGLDVKNAQTNPIYVDGVKAETEKVYATDIHFPEKKVTLFEGETTTILAALTPIDAIDLVTYTSEKPSVASVNSETGEVTGVKHGTTKITATTESGLSATYQVKVKKVPSKEFKLNKTKLTLKKKDSYQLKADFKDKNGEEAVTFISLDTKIATVSSTGKIKAIKEGTTTIKVTSVSGIEKTCIVTVKK